MINYCSVICCVSDAAGCEKGCTKSPKSYLYKMKRVLPLAGFEPTPYTAAVTTRRCILVVYYVITEGPLCTVEPL